MQCYKCKQWGHKANDQRCPLFKKKDLSSSYAKTKHFKTKEPWKHVEPKDLSKPIKINDKQWFFCTKCKCRATGCVGFYWLLHTDATHDPSWTPKDNLSPVGDPDPTPVMPLCLPIASQALDDELIFTGVNHAPVVMPLSIIDKREGEYMRSTEGAVLRDRCQQTIRQRTSFNVVDTTRRP